jgi:hypothetical protein
MRSVRIALGAGLALTLVASVIVLSGSPPRVLAASSVAARTELASTGPEARACQAGEVLPAGTTAIRLSLGAFTGPAVSVKAVSAGRVITAGAHGSGWDGQALTVAVRAVPRSVAPASVCFSISTAGGEGATLFGTPTKSDIALRAGNGVPLKGRLKIEYLGYGKSSWLALLPSVAQNLGLGRAWSGLWVVFLVPALMLLATALASRLIARELHD